MPSRLRRAPRIPCKSRTSPAPWRWYPIGGCRRDPIVAHANLAKAVVDVRRLLRALLRLGAEVLEEHLQMLGAPLVERAKRHADLIRVCERRAPHDARGQAERLRPRLVVEHERDIDLDVGADR